MIIVDANLLLYAYDSASPRHGPARSWLETILEGDEQVGFSLVTLLAFVRIATSPMVFERPLPVRGAIALVQEWLTLPNVALTEPGGRHWSVLAGVAEAGQARGSLIMDAHLATLAVEHGATIHTTDRDFARFPGLRFKDPIPAR
ncbi:MAG: type II toxin-antitoxin system VapC family toxin [Candidatus Limnocylindrales bacterium]|nr:type II toxin-antitoxin system VapC family toxin [Chloroflexota bacterium]